MVDVSPQSAFLVALNNAFNAARANAPQGNLGAGIPSLQAASSENGPGSPGGPAGVSIGGGVPGTATTGQGIANALLGGEAVPATAASQDVRNALLSRDPNVFGEDMGASPGGGDLGAFGAMLTNPLVMPFVIAQMVSGQGEGVPGTFLGGPLERGIQGDPNPTPFPQGTTIGPGGQLFLGGEPLGRSPAPNPPPRKPPVPQRDTFGDRPERTLSRERTTGRAAGPV